METLTVTEAKPRLGELVDLALRSKPVFIRRGRKVVQIVPAVFSDPIPVWPEGALARTDEQIAFLQQLTCADEAEPLQR